MPLYHGVNVVSKCCGGGVIVPVAWHGGVDGILNGPLMNHHN